MDQIEKSQQRSDPVDEEFFQLFYTAVELGINLVRDLERRKIYLGGHLRFHRAYKVEGSSMPGFVEMGLKDYGQAFGSKADYPIQWKEQPPIVDLVNYALETEPINSHFRVSKYSMAGPDYQLTDSQLEWIFIDMFGSIVDMCLHKLAQGEFSADWFKPWYRELERGIFDKELEVDLVVPIVALSFDFDSNWLDEQKVAIFKMNNEFQEARFLDQQFDIKVPSSIAGFSSHAFMLKGRRIVNDGFLQISYEGRSLIEKEISLINSLFGLLKAATGNATGYAQVVLHPVMWAPRYRAHLPVVLSETMRAYPVSFDRGVWVQQPEIVLSNHLDSVSGILKAKNVFNHKKIGLALSRLNSCLLRENKEDQILDACIGLEALFGDNDKQEMTHKLALRIAAITHLFDRGEYLKKDIFRAVKTIYGYRSAVAHGGSSDSKNQFVTVAGNKIPTVEFAIDILRETIIALGKNPRFLDPAEIDIYILILLDSPS